MPTASDDHTVVCSWNEWDPLRHVIVGVATNGCFAPSEHAFKYHNYDERGRELTGPMPQHILDKGNEELDNLADVLRKRGIRVDRPTAIDFSQPIVTPDFRIHSMIGSMPARDVLLTVGNEILEAAMSYRSRYFEYLAYRPLLEKYFEQDPNFIHASAPKPRCSDRSYHVDFFANDRFVNHEHIISRANNQHYVTTEEEVLFDAADATRCGKDIFVQHGFTTNLKGIEWLRRHYPDHRIHKVYFLNDPDPIHIDCSLVPLRPGLAMCNPNRPMVMEAGKETLFERNGWEVVMAAKPAHQKQVPLCSYSIWLSMNFLTLDPKTVICEETEVYQNDQLDKLGFEVITIPFRNAYAFGGSIHCATADVFREGDCQDYFPHQ